MSRGVTVICIDSDLTGHEEYRTAAVLTADPEQIGRGQIELLGSLIGYSGKFAILSATTDAPNQNMWIDWMKKALTDPKYSKMELVDTVYGNDEPQKSLTEAEATTDPLPRSAGITFPHTTVGIAACGAGGRKPPQRKAGSKFNTSPASAPQTRCADSLTTAPSKPSPFGAHLMKVI